MFTCYVVNIPRENLGSNDIQWIHMNTVITPERTNSYMIMNDLRKGLTQLNSTLIITNVRREHVGPYQFVIKLNAGDQMSRSASLTALQGTEIV